MCDIDLMDLHQTVTPKVLVNGRYGSRGANEVCQSHGNDLRQFAPPQMNIVWGVGATHAIAQRFGLDASYRNQLFVA